MGFPRLRGVSGACGEGLIPRLSDCRTKTNVRDAHPRNCGLYAAWVPNTEQERMRERQAQGGGWVAVAPWSEATARQRQVLHASSAAGGVPGPGEPDTAIGRPFTWRSSPCRGWACLQRCRNREFRTFLDTFEARMSANVVVDNLHNQQDPCLDSLARPLHAVRGLLTLPDRALPCALL